MATAPSISTTQSPTLLNAAATVSAATSAVTRTLTAPAQSRITLRSIIIFASAASNVTLTVRQGVGGADIVDYGTLALTTQALILVTNVTLPPGTNCLIVAGAGSAGTTTITTVADAQ